MVHTQPWSLATQILEALASRVVDDGGHVLYQWAAEALAGRAQAQASQTHAQMSQTQTQAQAQATRGGGPVAPVSPRSRPLNNVAQRPAPPPASPALPPLRLPETLFMLQVGPCAP